MGSQSGQIKKEKERANGREVSRRGRETCRKLAGFTGSRSPECKLPPPRIEMDNRGTMMEKIGDPELVHQVLCSHGSWPKTTWENEAARSTDAFRRRLGACRLFIERRTSALLT